MRAVGPMLFLKDLKADADVTYGPVPVHRPKSVCATPA